MLNKDDKIDNTDTFLEISDEEIIKSFSSLEEGKASGPDEISVSILKNCQDSLLLPFKLIYNKSFREGRVPALWKCANVTPIYKKGSKSDCLNYRPVITYMHIKQIIGKNRKGKNDNPTNRKQVVQCGTAWFLKKRINSIKADRVL